MRRRWPLVAGSLAWLWAAVAWAEEVCSERLAVCPGQGYLPPRDISTEGARVDELFWSATLFGGVFFVLMVVWMLWSILFHRKGEAEYEPSPSGKRGRLLVYGLIFGALVIDDGHILATVTEDLGIYWGQERFDGKREPEILRLEVNAHQWAWDVRYAGPDGEFATDDDVVSLNDVRIPAGVPVVVQMTSTDVIHGFYLPNLRMKFDAVPGMVNQFWFQVRESTRKSPTLGSYEFGCSQHCGVNHYQMKGRLIVQTREEFNAWMARAARNAARQAVANVNDAGARWGWPWRTR
jgi:cytochrome c oxidase subunit 2